MRIAALFDLAERPWLKASFAPAVHVAPPPPLLLDAPEICAPGMAGVHEAVAGPVEALGCYALDGAVVVGPCHVTVKGVAAVAPDLVPAYWRKGLEDGTLGDAPYRHDLPVREVAHPVAMIATLGYREYGHWLLDILPRLWTLADSGLAGPDVRIALPSDTPAFGLALLARLGIGGERLLRHDSAEERLAPARLLLPSLAHTDYRLHPASVEFYDGLVARHAATGTGRPTRLFLSRAQYGRPGVPGRHLVNHDMVRAALEARGFTTVFPERLPWPEQLALFAGARVVVGEHGSAMKNLLFTPPGTVVVNIHLLNNTQSQIAALRRHHLIYLGAEDVRRDETGRMEYQVGLAALSRCVAAALEFVGCP